MTNKEFLMQISDVNRRMQVIEEDLKEKLQYDTRGAVDYSKDKVTSSNQTDVSDLVVANEEAINECVAKIKNLLAIRAEVISVIDKVMPNHLCTLLYHRYVFGRDWKEIAGLIKDHEDCNVDDVRGRMHTDALVRVGEIRKLQNHTKTHKTTHP